CCASPHPFFYCYPSSSSPKETPQRTKKQKLHSMLDSTEVMQTTVLMTFLAKPSSTLFLSSHQEGKYFSTRAHITPAESLSKIKLSQSMPQIGTRASLIAKELRLDLI